MAIYLATAVLVWIIESVAIAHRAAFSETWKPDRVTVLAMAGMLALVWPLTCALRGWQLAGALRRLWAARRA